MTPLEAAAKKREAQNRDTCARCQFYSASSLMRWGECRRSAPRVMFTRDDVGIEKAWPPVDSTDWCGEFMENRQLDFLTKESIVTMPDEGK